MPSIISQPVDTRLTKAAIFLVAVINSGPEAEAAVQGLCADLQALIRGVGFRVPDGRLSCIMGIGSQAWDRLFGAPKPAGLHPFREIHGKHHAVATPGDLLFHICAARTDLCFEMATQIVTRLASAVAVVDEVHASAISTNAICLALWTAPKIP